MTLMAARYTQNSIHYFSSNAQLLRPLKKRLNAISSHDKARGDIGAMPPRHDEWFYNASFRRSPPNAATSLTLVTSDSDAAILMLSSIRLLALAYYVLYSRRSALRLRWPPMLLSSIA